MDSSKPFTFGIGCSITVFSPFLSRFRRVGWRVIPFVLCGTSSFALSDFIVLNGSSGAKSRVKRLSAVLSARIVGGPSSGQAAQHDPALSVSVSPSEFYVPAQL